MSTLKGWITTTLLIATLATSTMTTSAGVVIGGRSTDNSPCTGKVVVKDDLGGVVIGGGFVGVVIGGIIGVVIGGASFSESTIDCGVVIGG